MKKMEKKKRKWFAKKSRRGKGKTKDPKGKGKGDTNGVPDPPAVTYPRVPKGTSKGEDGKGKQRCIFFDKPSGCNQGRNWHTFIQIHDVCYLR